jgi:hypothetical protein
MTRALAFVAELALWIVVALIAATVFAGGQTSIFGSPVPYGGTVSHADELRLGSAGI